MNDATDKYFRFHLATNFEFLIEAVDVVGRNSEELRNDYVYNKRWDRWFDFNLNYSARKLNEPDLVNVTFESIDNSLESSIGSLDDFTLPKIVSNSKDSSDPYTSPPSKRIYQKERFNRFRNELVPIRLKENKENNRSLISESKQTMQLLHKWKQNITKLNEITNTIESFQAIPNHETSSFKNLSHLTLREKLKILSNKIKESEDQVRPSTPKTPKTQNQFKWTQSPGSVTYSNTSLFITPPPSPASPAKRSMLPKLIPLKKKPWYL